MKMKFCPAFSALLVSTLVSWANEPIKDSWGEPVWSDEFNGSNLSRTNWTYDLGGGGWGNNELEYYTDRPENAYLTNGCLVIEVRRESFRNREYTSARLKTQGLHAWTYGRIEARMNLPDGKGIWPAFWMLGASFPKTGWPGCGELDIMEHVSPIGQNTIRGSAHGPGYSGGDSYHGDARAKKLAGEFHVFAIEWEPSEIRWYLDENLYFSVKPQSVRGKWVFDQPFFILFNLAIGGNWPGPPDSTTVLPAKMLVDYVRVYQRHQMPAQGVTLPKN